MSLSYGLLGMLNYFPMSGYDLKKVFDDSINFFWAAQTSQIYRELKALEKKGAIISKVHLNEKGPNKRIYEITDQGRISLKKWLENPPDQIHEDQRNDLLIRILHSSLIGFEKLYPQIEKRLQVYHKELQQLSMVEKKLTEYLEQSGNLQHLPYWKIVLSRGRHVNEGNIRWAEESLAFLKKNMQKN